MKWAFCVAIFLMMLVSSIGWTKDQPDRIIRAGDKIKISCVEESRLNNTYTITKDGLIVLPFIGALEVAGKTAQDAVILIATELMQQRILKTATVGLEFEQPATAGIKYAGALKQSGQFPFAQGLRLSDVLRVAGMTSLADLARVEITSFNGAKRVVQFIDDPSAPLDNNPYLADGDSIFVPEQAKPQSVFILGGIRNPGLKSLKPGTTLRQAIAQAGGFDEMGDPRRVRLERERQPAIIYDLADQNRDITLLAGDRIIVELRPTRQFVTVVGEVARPGVVEFREGMTLTQAIADAGGIRDERPIERVSIYNAKTDYRTAASYNLQKIVQGFLGDVVLQPGDRVEAIRPGQKRPAGAALFAAAAAIMIYLGR